MSKEGSSGGDARGLSVVDDAGRSRSTCGYCKSMRSSRISHGLWAETLTVDDYQDLLDRGWRRSGCYLYKPEMEMTCCPAYTIRLRAKDFIPSKEQLRVSRKMQRYLDGIRDGKTPEPIDKSNNLQSCAVVDEYSSLPEESLATKAKQNTEEQEIMNYLSEQLELATHLFVKRRDVPCDIQFPKGFVKKVSQTKKKWFVEGAEDLLYTSNLSFGMAAMLRRTKSDRNEDSLPGSKKQSLDVNGSLSDLSPTNIAEVLTDALQRLVRIPALLIRACNGHINFYSAAKDVCSDKENQSVAPSNKSSIKHESKGCSVEPEKSQKKKKELEIHLKRTCFDPEEFALYRKYQIQVHNDKPEEVTESSYTRFLIDTPLIFVPPTGDDSVPSCGFGSFHQQYRIDGKLIAVGVIDILPKCVSSKYLFWDPDLAFLSLGKFSALQEIQWVKQNQHQCPSLEYYYLGYYIHSCSKMRYKAAYWPSELLCPLRYEWVLFDIAKPLLDRKKYAVLSDYANAQNVESLLTEGPTKTSDMLCDDLDDGDSNDAFVDRDAKILDSDSELSEAKLYHETSNLASVPTDVGNILLGLNGACVRYKDLQADLDPDFWNYFKNRLSRYCKLVGPRLSERMVYSVI